MNPEAKIGKSGTGPFARRAGFPACRCWRLSSRQFIAAVLLTLLFLALNQPTWATDTNTVNGLYCVSTIATGPAVKMPDGSTIHLGAKAPMQIIKATIYSENNANSNFLVFLDTTDFPADPKTGAMPETIVLRIGNRAYTCSGYGGRTGMYNDMQFNIPDRNEAEVAARGLSVPCILRQPPGYKYFAEFTPAKSEFVSNEPVTVKFSIKNLDDRTMAFQNGGSQRGARNNQFGFRAMFGYMKPVPDVGDPINFGGLCGLVKLEPGKTFDAEVDLKKWFTFDKPGTYSIHGFYALALYKPSDGIESLSPANLLWSDYAAADFTVTVK
jgi:hypothetical protein